MKKPHRDAHEFALCLTHDVDRPYKTFQAPYYALTERDLTHVMHFIDDRQPYWQFEAVMERETEFGVRSSFYFLNEKKLLREKPPAAWVNPRNWMLFAGRYDVTDQEIVDVIEELDRGGWEVGIHGSFESYTDRSRLRTEKETLEGVLGREIIGGRQHYLNLERPTTWKYHREIGLRYDATLGSNETAGFHHGYGVFHPFDDGFTVFPLTIMETAVMNEMGSPEAAWKKCRSLLDEAAENDAVMTILWHPRVFNEREFPGYAELYTKIVRKALQMDAWVGPCGEYYERFIA